MSYLNLNQLEKGEKAKVVELNGGYGLQKRLNSMGIMVGKDIKKVSSSFFRGPVTIEIGQARVAIGHGMADKIQVKEDGNR